MNLFKGEVYNIPSRMVTKESKWSVEVDGTIHEFYTPFRYLNHSDNPNADVCHDDNGFYIEIIRDIPARTEVAFHYGDDWDVWVNSNEQEDQE
jgi:hypothetical protein